MGLYQLCLSSVRRLKATAGDVFGGAQRISDRSRRIQRAGRRVTSARPECNCHPQMLSAKSLCLQDVSSPKQRLNRPLMLPPNGPKSCLPYLWRAQRVILRTLDDSITFIYFLSPHLLFRLLNLTKSMLHFIANNIIFARMRSSEGLQDVKKRPISAPVGLSRSIWNLKASNWILTDYVKSGFEVEVGFRSVAWFDDLFK
jgi:hypothetical protein